MFTMTMIYLAITSNIELIAFTIIASVTVAIAIRGEHWMEAIIARDPEWWTEERDMSIKAIWNRRKK